MIVESDGEWAYEEGCLSVPGLSWEIVRPKEVHLDGRTTSTATRSSIEADEIAGPAASSTSSTTSTACCCSSGSTPTPASRRCKTIRELGIGPSVLAAAEPPRRGLSFGS